MTVKNKAVINLVFVCLTVLSMSAILSPPCKAQDIVRLTVGEWSPYLSEEMESGGILLQVVTEAFALEGITVKYEFLPWKRAMVYVEQGMWDGSPGWTKTPERLTTFYYSDPIFDSKGVFFHLKSYAFDWKTIKDLEGIPIGGTIGYHYGKMIQDAEASGRIQIQRIPSDIQNFNKLLAGRIMLFPQLLEVGYDQLKRNFTPQYATRS